MERSYAGARARVNRGTAIRPKIARPIRLEDPNRVLPYSKRGINYGIGGATDAVVNADLAFLSKYFSKLRITYPSYNTASMAYWQNICLLAKAQGFEVMWGISCPNALSGSFDKFLEKFAELAPWAERNGIRYGVNEEAFHNNDAIISDTKVFEGLMNTSRSIKQLCPNVKLVISVAGDGELDALINHKDIGGFDYVGLNQYDSLTNFRANILKHKRAFGDKALVTEFSSGRGFDPGYGSEVTWKSEIGQRSQHMASLDVCGYFYTYANNPERTAFPQHTLPKWDIRIGMNPRTHRDAFDIFMTEKDT